MKFIRFDDWRRLRGAEVEVWLNGTLQRTGVIEEATEDAAIAWLEADLRGPRRLLERASGFELRISPEQAILRATLRNLAQRSWPGQERSRATGPRAQTGPRPGPEHKTSPTTI